MVTGSQWGLLGWDSNDTHPHPHPTPQHPGPRRPESGGGGGQGHALQAALIEGLPTSPHFSRLQRQSDVASQTQLPFPLFPLKLLSCVNCHLNSDGLSLFRPLCGEPFFKSSSEAGPSVELRGGWGTGVVHSLLNGEMTFEMWGAFRPSSAAGICGEKVRVSLSICVNCLKITYPFWSAPPI